MKKENFKLDTSVRRNEWVPDLSRVIFLIILAYCLRDFFICYDALWQVKIGEWIWNHKAIPRFDPDFAISSELIPWKNHQWLGELILFGLWKIGGFFGLRLILSLIPAFIFSRAFVLLRKQGVSPLSAFFFILIAVLSSAHHWLARPHLIAYVLLITSVILWEKSYEGNSKTPFILALVHLLWANLHQSFLIQFIFAASFAFQLLADYFEKRSLSGRVIRNIVGLLICLPLITAMNPHGFGAFRSTGATWAIRKYIEEWQPVYFHSKYFPCFFAYSVLLVLSFLSNQKNVKSYELAIFTCTVLLTTTAVRQIPIFVLSTLPFYVRHIPLFSRKAAGFLEKKFSAVTRWYTERNRRIHACEQEFSGNYFVLCCWALLFFISVAGFHNPRLTYWNGLNKNFFPIPASDFMERENIKGNIFNIYAWGGYLLFRFGNDNKIFIDGRTDMYGPERLEEYDQILEARSGWETLFDKYDIQIALISSEWGLSKKLSGDPDWLLVFSDKQASVFVQKEKFPQKKSVIPAQAGIQKILDPRFRGGDKR